jgi:hypothetical protein
VTTVTLECSSCGDAAVFNNFEDDEDALDAWIAQELWTVSDTGDLCPSCGGDDD